MIIALNFALNTGMDGAVRRAMPRDFPPHLSSRVVQDSCLHAVMPQGALIDLVDDDWRMETLPDTGGPRRSRAPRGHAGARGSRRARAHRCNAAS